MDNSESDGSLESEWDDRGDLAWNEFDWERYLREQDKVIDRYLVLYDTFKNKENRIDLVAAQMGWEPPEEADDEAPGEDSDEEDDGPSGFTDEDVYTLHKNPVFIATKAIYIGIRRPWEVLASDSDRVPPALAMTFLASLHRGEGHAVQAIHALDFGDYAMAVSLFKRALSSINDALALLSGEDAANRTCLLRYRDDALPRLFDLREVWLRVVNECRRELSRPVDGDA